MKFQRNFYQTLEEYLKKVYIFSSLGEDDEIKSFAYFFSFFISSFKIVFGFGKCKFLWPSFHSLLFHE